MALGALVLDVVTAIADDHRPQAPADPQHVEVAEVAVVGAIRRGARVSAPAGSARGCAARGHSPAAASYTNGSRTSAAPTPRRPGHSVLQVDHVGQRLLAQMPNSAGVVVGGGSGAGFVHSPFMLPVLVGHLPLYRRDLLVGEPVPKGSRRHGPSSGTRRRSHGAVAVTRRLIVGCAGGKLLLIGRSAAAARLLDLEASRPTARHWRRHERPSKSGWRIHRRLRRWWVLGCSRSLAVPPL